MFSRSPLEQLMQQMLRAHARPLPDEDFSDDAEEEYLSELRVDQQPSFPSSG